MNQPTTYEQLIAVKLQELSAPAKIDAIWARIEQQLDVEMPTDESGSTDTGASSHPGFFFPGNKFLYVFLAAVAGIYFLTRTDAIQNEAPVTNFQQPFEIIDSTDGLKNPPKNRDSEVIFTDKADMPVNDPGTPNDSIMTPIEQPVSEDIVTKEPEPSIPSPVSTAIQEIKKPLAPTVTDTSSKKGKGVKGLNLSDYKIVPVKKGNQP